MKEKVEWAVFRLNYECGCSVFFEPQSGVNVHYCKEHFEVFMTWLNQVYTEPKDSLDI